MGGCWRFNYCLEGTTLSLQMFLWNLISHIVIVVYVCEGEHVCHSVHRNWEDNSWSCFLLGLHFWVTSTFAHWAILLAHHSTLLRQSLVSAVLCTPLASGRFSCLCVHPPVVLITHVCHHIHLFFLFFMWIFKIEHHELLPTELFCQPVFFLIFKVRCLYVYFWVSSLGFSFNFVLGQTEFSSLSSVFLAFIL